MTPSAVWVVLLFFLRCVVLGERRIDRGVRTLGTDVSNNAVEAPEGWKPIFHKLPDDCPMVRQALLNLGVPAADLKPGLIWDGVHWSRQWYGNADVSDCDVREISLRGRHLNGRLSPELGNLTRLRKLELDGLLLTGDIGVLQNLKDLQRVFIRDTNIRGDIGIFSEMSELSLLDLSNTRVGGDLKSLRLVFALQELHLAGTDVRGDLSSVGGMTASRIRILNLADTGIHGDVGEVRVFHALRNLELERTAVHGDIAGLLELKELRTANLASTQVTGAPNITWSFKLRSLLFLNLADTKVQFLQIWNQNAPVRFLPRIEELDISGCPLNGKVQRLLQMLQDSYHLARLRAARGNLTGEVSEITTGHLPDSLLLLDLSDNNISKLSGLPGRSLVQISLSRNNVLEVTKSALLDSLQREIQVDLRDSSISDPLTVRELFMEGQLVRTHEAVNLNTAASYYCHGITSETLRITPELFSPAELCACLPGSRGVNLQCVHCEHDTYNDLGNQTHCNACPRHSRTASTGANSVSECSCDFGRISSDQSSCVCDNGAALSLSETDCGKCEEFHLECDGPGHSMASAPPKIGFARLRANATRAFRCLEPASPRCNNSNASDLLGCASGYSGPLCTTCTDGYRSKGKFCKKCKADGFKLSRPKLAAGLFLATFLVTGAVLFWWQRRRSRRSGEPAGPLEVLLPLLRAQLSVLLQFVQLWSVLAAMAQSSSFWEQEYVQWLQLTTGGLRDALSLECTFGEKARFVSALAGPVVPLAVLLLCALLEVVARSTGVRVALKVLPFLFIGGASSCAQLMTCQHFDGGYQSLGDEAFRALLPHLTCADESWQSKLADGIGLTSALSYYILIPGLMLYLLKKQKRALAPSRQSMATAELRKDSAVVRLQVFQAHDSTSESFLDKDTLSRRRLLAAAVAHSVVYFQGQVQLQLQGDEMLVRLVQGHEGALDLSEASNLVDVALRDQQYLTQNRWIKITRMLTERCVFQEAEQSDRVLAGAKRLFCKYAIFEHVWFEVALKLASVTLVTFASNDADIEFCIGLALVMSASLASSQPYVQRQANNLHSFCFLCLAAASLGFAQPNVWLARGALAMPFVLAMGQILRPDGPEALAIRLYEAAEQQLPELEQGEPLEFTVATKSFV